jgi:uncharacterized protein (TIGR03382 family)
VDEVLDDDRAIVIEVADEAGNVASATLRHVEPSAVVTPEATAVGCSTTGDGAGLAWLAVGLCAWVAGRSRRARGR